MAGRDYVSLGQVELQRPVVPPPIEVYNLRQRPAVAVGDFTLLGYDAFKRGFDHAPDTPIRAGDEVQVTLLWQARAANPRLTPPLADDGCCLRVSRGDQGQTVPIAPLAALRQLAPGETVITRAIVPIPPDFPPGRYDVTVGDIRAGGLDIAPP